MQFWKQERKYYKTGTNGDRLVLNIWEKLKLKDLKYVLKLIFYNNKFQKMPTIYIDKLIRTDRNTLSLEIDKLGKLIVRAPKKLPLDEIHNFISKKEKWIKEKQEKVKVHVETKQQIKYEDGAEFFLTGKTYPLYFIANYKYAMNFEDEQFKIDLAYKKYAKSLFEQFYKIKAKNFIIPRVVKLSKDTGLKINDIKISSAIRRWGSCNSKKILNFSWRLVLAPEFAIDYVIIHELAHTKELNHSDRFWQIVEKLCPDYKLAEKWLKDNGFMLEL